MFIAKKRAARNRVAKETRNRAKEVSAQENTVYTRPASKPEKPAATPKPIPTEHLRAERQLLKEEKEKLPAYIAMRLRAKAKRKKVYMHKMEELRAFVATLHEPAQEAIQELTTCFVTGEPTGEERENLVKSAVTKLITTYYPIMERPAIQTVLDPIVTEITKDMIHDLGSGTPKDYRSMEDECLVHLGTMVREFIKPKGMAKLIKREVKESGMGMDTMTFIRKLVKLGDYSETRNSDFFQNMTKLIPRERVDLKKFMEKYGKIFKSGNRDAILKVFEKEDVKKDITYMKAIFHKLDPVDGRPQSRPDTARLFEKSEILSSKHAEYEKEKTSLLDTVDKYQCFEHWKWYINLMILIAIHLSRMPSSFRPVTTPQEESFKGLLRKGLTVKQATDYLLQPGKRPEIEESIDEQTRREVQRLAIILEDDPEVVDYCQGLVACEQPTQQPYRDTLENWQSTPDFHPGTWWRDRKTGVYVTREKGKIIPVSESESQRYKEKICQKELAILFEWGCTVETHYDRDQDEIIMVIVPPRDVCSKYSLIIPEPGSSQA